MIYQLLVGALLLTTKPADAQRGGGSSGGGASRASGGIAATASQDSERHGSRFDASRSQGYYGDLSNILVDHTDADGRLLQHLSRNYDKRKRPVRNYSDTINVRFSLTLYQLLEVNEPEEYIVLNVWMTHEWYDEYLIWDPADFGNISHVILPWEQVWLSDIVLYNGLGVKHEHRERINVELEMLPGDYNRSKIIFSYPAVYKFNCWLDVYYFPNDIQNCTLVLGSWIYNQRQVDVYPSREDVNLRFYLRNQAWDVLSFKAYRHLLNSTRSNISQYATVQYHFVMQRKPFFFIANLVVPTIIVAWISFIGFFTPGHTGSERTEKVNLGISTCVAMSIFLLIVSSRMPASSTYVPIMAWFFIAIIVMVAAAIFASAVVIMIHRQWRYGKRIPWLIHKMFFEIIARALFVEVPPYVHDQKYTGTEPSKTHFANGFGGAKIYRLSKVSYPPRSNNDTADAYFFDTDLIKNGHHVDSLKKRRIGPRHFNNHQNSNQWADAIDVCVADISEWEVLADVVERLFLFLFSLLLILVSLGMMLAIFNSKQTKMATTFQM